MIAINPSPTNKYKLKYGYINANMNAGLKEIFLYKNVEAKSLCQL